MNNYLTSNNKCNVCERELSKEDIIFWKGTNFCKDCFNSTMAEWLREVDAN